MNSLPATSNDPTITKSLTDYTFDEAQAFKKEAVWQNLSGITINQAIAE